MRKEIIAILVVALLAVTASGATLLVPSQYATIQAGINASSNGDTVLVAAGTYIGTGNKNISFGGRNIVVLAELGPENTTLDCQNSGQGFYFSHPAPSFPAISKSSKKELLKRKRR